MCLYIISVVKQIVHSHISPQAPDSHKGARISKSDWAGLRFANRTYIKKYMLGRRFFLTKSLFFYRKKQNRPRRLFVPPFTKINSQASKSVHPQGKQVWCLALRKLISLSVCTHTLTYKAPEIHSCRGATLNSESIVFYNRQSTLWAIVPIVNTVIRSASALSGRISGNEFRARLVSSQHLEAEHHEYGVLRTFSVVVLTWGKTGFNPLLKQYETGVDNLFE